MFFQNGNGNIQKRKMKNNEKKNENKWKNNENEIIKINKKSLENESKQINLFS